MNPFDTYFDESVRLRAQIPVSELAPVLEWLERARVEQRHVFVFGNGGSASAASHFAADLSKNTRRAYLPHFRVTCLNDNMAMFSAYGNDEGYDSVFAEPLKTLARAGDIAIAISASGNSPNVLRAVEAANALGLHTIGFAGFDGGKLGQLAQRCIIIPSTAYEHIEDAHLMLCHALVATLKQKYPAQAK